MSGPGRSHPDATPPLVHHHHYHRRFSSHPAAVEMTTAPPPVQPRRSVYLGVDVGTGSARAGPFFTSFHPFSLSYAYEMSFLGFFFVWMRLILMELGLNSFCCF